MKSIEEEAKYFSLCAIMDYEAEEELNGEVDIEEFSSECFKRGIEFAQRIEWREINGYEGIYEVSSTGEIKSLQRKSRNNKNNKQILISRHVDKCGYLHVGLTDYNGIRKNHNVHRLVALCFVENPLNLEYVNHIDGNKQNNNYLNLEWVTRSENQKHAYRTGLQSPTKYWAGKHGALHHSSKKVVCLSDGKCFDSIVDAANNYCVKRCSVSLVCRGKLKTTGGLIFSFLPIELK